MKVIQFALGKLVATPTALDALKTANEPAAKFILRHRANDWGDVDAADKRTNDHAVRHDLRLLSSYRLSTGVKIWIITEWDRSVTTILLPEDY